MLPTCEHTHSCPTHLATEAITKTSTDMVILENALYVIIGVRSYA